MNNLSYKIIAVIMFMIGSFFGSYGQNPVDGKNREKVVSEIAATYTDWKSAAWQGKVRTDMLPISPTMKVYMKNGAETLISLRVPLMGEVARIEIDNDSLLVVNKMKKRYCSIPFSSMGQLPAGLSENVQSLLLGRVALIGRGELQKKYAKDVELFEMPDAGWLIVPKLPDGFEGGLYGYAVGNDAKLTSIIVTDGRPNAQDDAVAADSFSFAADIAWVGNGATAMLALTSKKLNASVEIQGEAIEWGVKPTERIKLNGYRRASLKECMRF